MKKGQPALGEVIRYVSENQVYLGLECCMDRYTVNRRIAAARIL